MTILFYLLGYLGVICCAVTAFLKIRKYVKSTPLHLRWEIYPIPHEGARANHGGSYMEDVNWWEKGPRKHYVLGDLKALIMEVLFLEATFKHNRPLWYRTYPFHFGLYMLMGGGIVLFLVALLRLCGASTDGLFLTLIFKLIEIMAFFGLLGIIIGGLTLIYRRLSDAGLRMMSTPEHFFDIGLFVAFGVVGFATWCTNASFAKIGSDFVYNMLTLNWVSLGSGGFTAHMLLGFFLMAWIPVTFMSHILLKYFLYHDIRWEDEATLESSKRQAKMSQCLQFQNSWSAPHVNPNGQSRSWAEVATSGYPCHEDQK